jgi:hypothetical protein
MDDPLDGGQSDPGTGELRWASHEMGATLVYQGHFVSLVWQSKHVRTASARVSALSQRGSVRTGGFV